MDNKMNFSSSPVQEEGVNYQIKIKGYLDKDWGDQFEGLKITHDDQGNSLLTGVLPDQAALHGVLVQIRDLGMTLLSLTSRPNGVKGIEESNEGNE